MGQDWTYTYDAQGQLLTAICNGQRYNYTYDTYGNIRSVSRELVGYWTQYEHSYTYGNTQWLDLLTAYDDQPIAYEGQTYDETTNTVSGTVVSGNPISYYNGTRWSFDWSDGRKLISAESDDVEISFEYDQAGIRTTKTVDGVVHDYTYASGKLMRETITNTDDTTIVLDFFYDSNGRPYAMKYNGDLLYYVLNLQGDVIALIDNTDGSARATYTYDAWGNILSSSGDMDEKNPLRYRGYYYDSELGMYYLQSRYYDPTILRFINSDSFASTGQDFIGYNMFAYCNNSPTTLADYDGTFAGTVVGAIMGGISGLVDSIERGDSIGDTLINVAKETVIGASWGLLGDIAVALGGGTGLLLAGAVGGLQSAVDYVGDLDKADPIDPVEMTIEVIVGVGFGIVSFGMSSNPLAESGQEFMNRMIQSVTGETVTRARNKVIKYGTKRILKQTTQNIAYGIIESAAFEGMGWCTSTALNYYLN